MTKFDPLYKAHRNLRVIITASIVLAAILIANALVSIYLLRSNSIQDRSDQLANLTIILSEHTAQTLFSANTALKSIHDVIEIAKIDNEKSYREFASKKAQFDLLQEKTKSNSILDVSTFVANDGRVLNFSRSYPPPDINLGDRDYFKYLSSHRDSSIYYSAPVNNKGNGKWVFYLAQRLNGSDGEFLGIALVGVSVEVFSDLYERIGGNLGEGSAIALYRNDKTLMTRWPLVSDQIGKVSNSGFIEKSLQNADISGGVIFGDGPGFNRKNVEAVTRMISYREVKGYPFVVGAIVPESIYLENWYKNAIGVLAATVLSLIGLFFGTYFLFNTYRRDAQNQYRAHHDVLTELPNRTLFSDRLAQLLVLSKRNHSKFAILFLDLDNLKTINDQNNHTFGDHILVEVARRMRSSVRESDTVARLGGDEFIILLPEIDSENQAIQVAEKIRHAISMPIEFDGIQLQTSVSIGIALYPAHGLNEFDLMNNADIAMYQAKAGGRNTIRVFKPD